MTKQREPFNGMWRDTSLPDRARQVLHNLPGYSPGLEASVGELLYDYRFWSAHRDSIEPTSERRERLKDVATYAGKLSEAIKALPSDLQQKICLRIDEATQGRGPTRLTDTAEELEVLTAICRWGANDLRQLPPDKRGAKPKRLELQLLSDVAGLLEELPGMRVTRAAELAHEITLHCGVQTTNDPPRRAVRKYRGKN